MKNLLLFAILISLVNTSDAQVPTAMPPEAITFYNSAMPVMRESFRDVILQTAGAIKHYKANADSLLLKLRASNKLKGMSNNDIEGISVLIMVQASKEADADLKIMVLEMSRRNELKQEQKSTMQTASVNDTKNRNSPEEIKELQQMKLHMIMERKSMMAEQITNLMKNIAASQQAIIANLK